MNLQKLLAAIDAEIAKFEQAKALLLDEAAPKAKRGPKPKALKAAAKPAKRTHNLSPEARKKIADAQKKRWAAAGKKKSSDGNQAGSQ